MSKEITITFKMTVKMAEALDVALCELDNCHDWRFHIKEDEIEDIDEGIDELWSALGQFRDEEEKEEKE